MSHIEENNTRQGGLSRRAFIGSSAAALAALAAASVTGCAPNATSGATESKQQPAEVGPAETKEIDVVVIGAGPVGQSSALAAAEAGASVLVIERSGSCTGKHHVLAAWGTALQKEAGFDPTLDEYVASICAYKDRSSDLDEDMVRYTVEQMAPTYEWMEAHGVEFGRCCAINGEPFAGLSSVASVHGRDTAKAFTEVFEGCCLDAGVEFMFDTEANGLLLGEDGAVRGVTATASDGHVLEIHARSVALGTGGFGGDDELLRRYAPWIPNFGPLDETGQWTLGDGFAIREGKRIGADLCSQGGGGLIYKNFEGANTDLAGQALHVGSDGKRFCDESAIRFARTRSALDAGNGEAFILYDADLVNELYTGASSSGGAVATGEVSEAQEVLDAAIEAGSAYKADTIEELARLMNVNAAVLSETVAVYNAACVSGVDDQFGKPAIKIGVMDDPAHVGDFTYPQIEQEFRLLNEIKTPPFYATRVTYNSYQLFQTFGGLKIDKQAQVLDVEGSPIANLFAAGEAANGQMIGATYPFSGLAAAGTYIYGRLAGQSAAANAKGA